MSRRQTVRGAGVAAVALSCLAAVACGGERTTPQEAEPVKAAEATQGVPPKCDFATNVIGMFNTSTNETAVPTSHIGLNCTDTRKFSAYKSLF